MANQLKENLLWNWYVTTVTAYHHAVHCQSYCSENASPPAVHIGGAYQNITQNYATSGRPQQTSSSSGGLCAGCVIRVYKSISWISN